MRVLLRVVRAGVWLSSTALARQDGVLALVKAGASRQVVYGAPEETPDTPRSAWTKRWAIVPIRCNEAPVRQPVDVDVTDETAAEKAPAGSVEIVLFLLSSDSDRKRVKQRLTFLASTRLRLSVTDLQAVDGAREVLFKATLDGDLGTVEVAVQRADGAVERPHIRDEGDANGEGGFSVQWTSSAALERDLAAKERARVDAEKKLLERLAAAEASARRSQALRIQALEIVRHKRAAKAIQRGFRACKRRRRERKRQLRREQEERERQRKQALRDKVKERNQRRTQRLIEQWTTSETKRDEQRASNVVPELSGWMETQREATKTKLEMTLARLERERDDKLREMGCYTNDRRVRIEGEESPPKLLSDGLIHAIQRLHLRK